MLRRKLLIVFGLIVTLLLVTGVGAVWALQSLLGRLHHVQTEAWDVMDHAHELALAIGDVELELNNLDARRQSRLDQLLNALERAQTHLQLVSEDYAAKLPENAPLVRKINSELLGFTKQVSELATSPDPAWAARLRDAAIHGAIDLRLDILTLGRAAKAHGDIEQAELTARFRTTVLILAGVFIVVLNLSVIALVRIAGMIVRPVDRLVAATEALAQERFDHRVEMLTRDEFGVLARAFNNLAERLGANERRKLEALQQLAIALNHELNNVASMISMQIQLIDRQAGGNPQFDKFKRQIQESLGRMTRTLESIKHLRRIVLTDYIAGVKMLDIERSTAEETAHEPAEANIP
jgi:signal transduction histidine kinase